MGTRIGRATGYGALALLMLLAAPFVYYAADFGLRGLSRDLTGESYLFTPGDALANVAIFGHMLTGALITALAPLQLLPAIRRRWPALHRWTGRLIVPAALIAALGGLGYIALHGTIGGPWMDLAFAGYGALMLVAGVETFRHARARRFDLHHRWALRLFVLAIGSWLYRFHYWVWYAATGGLASNEAFTGAFDRVQFFAFYVPYLVALEFWLRRDAAPQRS